MVQMAHTASVSRARNRFNRVSRRKIFPTRRLFTGNASAGFVINQHRRNQQRKKILRAIKQIENYETGF
jgi:hypothetical protein